jgi:multiple sugar transport system substrate-binding protein
MILDNWWGPIYAWPTTNGAKIYDGEKFVGHEDPKSVEAFQFISDNVQGKTFTYAGSLPKGQGADAMFMSQQAAFVTAGRWYLPIFKQNSALEYDVVTWPTNTGNKIEPAPVATAYAVLNSKTANKDAAFALLTDFVSKEGQIFRLKGGGNAVPSVKGADEVVSEGNIPANWQAFIDARNIGYALWREQASVAGLNDDIHKILDELWLKGGDVKATLVKVNDAVVKKKGQA